MPFDHLTHVDLAKLYEALKQLRSEVEAAERLSKDVTARAAECPPDLRLEAAASQLSL